MVLRSVAMEGTGAVPCLCHVFWKSVRSFRPWTGQIHECWRNNHTSSPEERKVVVKQSVYGSPVVLFGRFINRTLVHLQFCWCQHQQNNNLMQSLFCWYLSLRMDPTRDPLISSMALAFPRTFLSSYIVNSEKFGYKQSAPACCSCWQLLGATAAIGVNFATSLRVTRKNTCTAQPWRWGHCDLFQSSDITPTVTKRHVTQDQICVVERHSYFWRKFWVIACKTRFEVGTARIEVSKLTAELTWQARHIQ